MIEHVHTTVVSFGDARDNGSNQGFGLHAEAAVLEAQKGRGEVGLAALASHLDTSAKETEVCEKHGVMTRRPEPCYECVIARNLRQYYKTDGLRTYSKA